MKVPGFSLWRLTKQDSLLTRTNSSFSKVVVVEVVAIVVLIIVVIVAVVIDAVALL